MKGREKKKKKKKKNKREELAGRGEKKNDFIGVERIQTCIRVCMGRVEWIF